jgi:hypothetical protein
MLTLGCNFVKGGYNGKEQTMKKIVRVFVMLLVAVLFSQPVLSESSDPTDQPWERFSFKLGGYIADLDSSVRIDSGALGAGVSVDVEDALDMDSTMSVWRAEVAYRFGKSQRHLLNLKYYEFNRDSSKTVGTVIEFKDKTYPIGTTVESYFNISVLKASYGYAFYQDDRISLAASLGLFITPIEVGISTGSVGSEEEAVTAPLPVVGLNMDFAITPKLFLKQYIGVFYLEIDDFKGSIVSTILALEYNAWKNVGFGIGYDIFNLDIEANGSDYPNIDFVGQIEFAYKGLMLYSKVCF